MFPVDRARRRGPDGGWKRFIPQSEVSKREVTILLQDLALLLRSGLPLDDGLKLLTDDASSARPG